jgi:NADH-quinone oxidoreductase subunit K
MITLPLANFLAQPVGVSQFVIVGAIMFTCGAVCMATKRNALGILMGIELVLNGANINFIAFGSPYLRNDAGSLGMDGQLMSLFVIVLAAAEAAVALAIALNFYNNFNSIDVDRASQLQG